MKVKDIAYILEQNIPLSWQESYDNAGLVVGDPEAEVEGLLVALDATEEVIREAVEVGATMVVTHHPIIFSPIKRLVGANRQQRAIALAMRNGVALYAAHTNLDSAPEVGLSHHLASLLGLEVERVFELGLNSSGNATRSASRLKINDKGDMLYWIDGGVWRMAIDAAELPAEPFIKPIEGATLSLYYALGVAPDTEEVYVGDALDYQQRSIIYRYSNDGELLDSFTTGVIAGDFCWKK